MASRLPSRSQSPLPHAPQKRALQELPANQHQTRRISGSRKPRDDGDDKEIMGPKTPTRSISPYGSIHGDPDSFETPEDKRKTLGRGSFGKVVAYRSEEGAQNIAVKKVKLNPDEVYGLDLRTAEVEGRALYVLQGIAHIPQLIGAKGTDHKYKLAMEQVAGKSLDNFNPHKTEEKDQKTIVRQLIETLEACHQRGVGHLDVKPGNVIWDAKTQNLTLVDFGSARFFKPASPVIEATGDIPLGTRGFRKPEIDVRGNLAQIDTYGMACVATYVASRGLSFKPEEWLQKEERAQVKDFLKDCLDLKPLPVLLEHAWMKS